MNNQPIKIEDITSISFKGKTYQRYVAGDNPEGKILLLAIPLSLKTDTYKDKETGAQKTFSYWAKIGNFGRGIPVANDFNLLVRANPPQTSVSNFENTSFSL